MTPPTRGEDDPTAAEVLARCDELLAAHPPSTTPLLEFMGHRFDAGLAWVHHPVGLGGLGLEPQHHVLANLHLTAAGAPDPYSLNPIGFGISGPTIAEHGTDEQRARYLRPLFTSEEVWCQLFSEPGYGSDLAGLATTAVRDGDHWVLNGQKVWASIAHLAAFGTVLARTDPEVPKHQGLSYFILDMHAPGVTVRPIVQMTGDAEFNEVFLTDVRVPDAARVGAVGDGWRVGLATLMNERVAIGGQPQPAGSGPIAAAVEQWRAHGARPAVRDELVQLWIDAEVLRLTNLRAAELRERGTPGPEGAIAKLASSELSKRIATFALDARGPRGTLVDRGYPMTRPDLDDRSPLDDPAWVFLRTRADTIAGGTTEVAKNLIGERILGLPRDDDRLHRIPWREVPR